MELYLVFYTGILFSVLLTSQVYNLAESKTFGKVPRVKRGCEERSSGVT